MTHFLPINLSGNLGERHRFLNSFVRDAFQSSVSFETIQDLPEASPVDRLFKIDLASKYRNVDYVFQNLKDTDMLYVSRAMKCTWLLKSEYQTKINANFLESRLFPDMTTTAVNKMKHWIQHHLRDPDRCRDFYNYYKEKEFKIAIKFLWHCSSEYILDEFKNVIDRLDPYNLKILSERCPKLTEIFYENLEQNRDILKRYLDHEKLYLFNIKYILKSDPVTFFNVVEKYFNGQKFNTFGPDITKHIMMNHRNRFFCKPELYTAWFLDINILSKCLSPEEVKKVVLTLARAEYLEHWFTYKKVEPLIKRLDKNEQVAFKKRIFVDKDFGDKIKDWPYSPPSTPIMKDLPKYSFFQDKEYDCIHVRKITTKRLVKKKKGLDLNYRIVKCRTLLDDLFDRYRFMSFEATLFELRKRLRAESKLQNREFMILVLVSKSGGREESLRALLELLSQYRNEPVHFRAAIVRSLVKRAFVWRLPDDLWANLLHWAHGMGLDGGPREIVCYEGVHAVVLRNLLAGKPYDPVVSKLFFENFTTFTQYSLSTTERSYLRTSLPNMLLAVAASEIGYEKSMRLGQLLSTLEQYKIRFDRFPGVIEAIAAAAKEDSYTAESLLPRLFNARVARKQLFKENFSIMQDNESYINALRHDISVIDVDKFNEIVILDSPSRYEQYFRKLVIYFAESEGLAEQHYVFFKHLAETQSHKYLAKPLCLLAGKDITLLLKTLDVAPKKTAERSLAAALRANAHSTRPRIEFNIYDWKTAGVKAIANIVSVSPRNQHEGMVKKLMTWGRTIRLALTLTETKDEICSVFNNMAELRPGLAIKMFLRHLKGGKVGPEFNTIWNIVKPLITELDYANRPRLFKNLGDIKSVPDSIKPEYYVLVYQVFIKKDKVMPLHLLSKIENICQDINAEFFTDLVKELVDNVFICDKMEKYDYIQKCCLYSRLIAKFLLLCKTDEIQKERIISLEETLFQRFEEGWKASINESMLTPFLETFLMTLKYNKVFFDAKYVSCMPVFERILAWLHSMLPIEKWFDVYINLHLTMLYYKAARLCINQKPEFFSGDSKVLDKGIDMFGVIFGKFVAHDYEELQAKYFQSIQEIYKVELMGYLQKFIDYTTYDQSKERFVIAFLKSILEEKDAKEAHVLASYVFVEHKINNFKYGFDLSGIVDLLKQTENAELRFCLQTHSPKHRKSCCALKL